ncbi:MAG: hypothetical protein Q4C96_07245 [Planctomycetia bacterium]|nr:hypothetical protein [Planctomycetia bacterium]
MSFVKKWRYVFYVICAWILIALATGGGINFLVYSGDITADNEVRDTSWGIGESNIYIHGRSSNYWGVRIPGLFFFCYAKTDFPRKVTVFASVLETDSPLTRFEGDLSITRKDGSILNKKISANMERLYSEKPLEVFHGDFEELETPYRLYTITGFFVDENGKQYPAGYHLSKMESMDCKVFVSWFPLLDTLQPPSFGSPIFWRTPKCD